METSIFLSFHYVLLLQHVLPRKETYQDLASNARLSKPLCFSVAEFPSPSLRAVAPVQWPQGAAVRTR